VERGSNPGSDKRFFSSTKRSDRLWGPPSLLFNEHRGSFPGKTQPEREINYLPPSRGEVKNGWRYTSTLPYAFKAWTGITLPLRLEQIQGTTGNLTTKKTQVGNFCDDVLPIFDNAKAKSATEKKKT